MKGDVEPWYIVRSDGMPAKRYRDDGTKPYLQP